MIFLTANQIGFLGYNTSIVDCAGPRSVPAGAYCNSWTVQNLGDIWVTVNGILLKGYPIGHPELTGAATGVSGNYGEVYQGNISIQSAQTTPGSGTTDFHCVVILKSYNLW